jgi:hypothetical protein
MLDFGTRSFLLGTRATLAVRATSTLLGADLKGAAIRCVVPMKAFSRKTRTESAMPYLGATLSYSALPASGEIGAPP